MYQKIKDAEKELELSIDCVVDIRNNSSSKDSEYLHFTSVQEAIDSAEENQPYIIYICKGIYKEKLDIDKSFITLIGEDREETILCFDVASGSKKEDGSKYGTFDSASVIVREKGFTAINLTIENSFNYMQEYVKEDDDPTKVEGLQAVAFRTTERSDQVKFQNCRFHGYQDTLLIDQGTHYFYQCFIEGAVDFIFGAGLAVFEECNIISLDRGDDVNNGFITAASTSIFTPYGYVFERCNIIKESSEMIDYTVYLGRPWHPRGNPEAQASVLFMECTLDKHIKQKPWTEMGGFSALNARLFEYDNTGLGAGKNEIRRELTQAEAKSFLHYLREKCVR
ncbi:pectinesterase family protein [Gracilibacillus sp. D59]|uniref:pectinesterase family protein n=1 Tax=Gracilibacillus sp. D59 TaxID=3457434 RepID=UPI003FCD1E1B